MEGEHCRRGICKAIFLFVIIFVLFFVPGAYAFTSINVFIDESGDAIFLGETDEEFLQLPSGIEINNGEIIGISSVLTDKEGETWTFVFALPDSELNIVMPEGTVIKDLSGGEISLDGNQISIYVSDSVKIEYVVERAEIIDAEGASFVVPLLALIFAALVIIIVYLVNFGKKEKKDKSRENVKKKPARKKDKFEILKQVLNDREKLIVEKLKETGKIKGSQLRKLCDIPKASFSRHVQELEKKGLIKRTGEGKNKFIELDRK